MDEVRGVEGIYRGVTHGEIAYYPFVANDLKNIKEYIAEDNKEIAVKTIQEIYTRMEDMQQFLYIGINVSKRVSFCTDYKYLISENYVIVYRNYG